MQGAVPPPWQPAEISVLRKMILRSGIGQWTEKSKSFSTPVQRTPKSLEAAYYKYISAEIRSLKVRFPTPLARFLSV